MAIPWMIYTQLSVATKDALTHLLGSRVGWLVAGVHFVVFKGLERLVRRSAAHDSGSEVRLLLQRGVGGDGEELVSTGLEGVGVMVARDLGSKRCSSGSNRVGRMHAHSQTLLLVRWRGASC